MANSYERYMVRTSVFKDEGIGLSSGALHGVNMECGQNRPEFIFGKGHKPLHLPSGYFFHPNLRK
jgi:hypothetical protein